MPLTGPYLIGMIALREKLITREQLFDCLQAQERNPSKTLGEIFVTRGYLRKDDVNRLLDLQRKEMELPDDGKVSPRSALFGKILIEKGLASEYQVNECLRLQGRLSEMGLKPVPMLGEIMIRHGYLKPDAVETALQFQNLSLYSCPECGASIEIEGSDSSLTEYKCPECGIEVPFLFAKMAAAVQHALDEQADEMDIELPAEVSIAAQDVKNHFGKYILVNEIGRGGTGIVYKAWQLDLNKLVALKLLPHESDTASGVKTPYGDAEDVKRFYSECRAAAELKHENIVPILDFGLVDNHFFLTMKLIEGTTLDEIIRTGDPGDAFQTTIIDIHDLNHHKERPTISDGEGLHPKISMELLLPLVRATAYAHSRGIFHRDIKPGNIIVDKEGRPWLMDFGLAKFKAIGDPAYVKGVIMGTPYYMPPEQAQGDMELVDDKSDLYSLGAVLYELLSGRCPYAGKSGDEVLDILENTPPDPVRDLLTDPPEDAVRIVDKAMRRLKRDRYPTAEAFAEDMKLFLLEKPLQPEPTGARPSGFLSKVKGLFKKS